MMSEELEIKKLEIKLEELKAKRMDKMHLNKMAELEIRKEIAILYRSKKQLIKIKKQQEKKK